MSTRTDEIALRSLLALLAALALVLVLRFTSFRYVKSALSKGKESVGMLLQDDTPDRSPVPVRKKPGTIAARDAVPQVAKTQRSIAVATPIPVTPPPGVSPITRLRVDSSQWSAPLNVPPAQRVGIKFSLGRIRVERDGAFAGILYRNPTLTADVTGRMSLRPLAALDRSPRVFWFDKGIRVLRFMSLEKQSEEVEVLWGK